MSFDDVDNLFGTDDIVKGYHSLKKQYEGGEKGNAELLWRLAKCCHEVSTRTSDKGRVKELIFEGQKYGLAANEADPNNFMALKWAAIMTGKTTDHLGTKEKIEQGGKFKELLDKALLVDPKEFSLLHSRGRYAFSVAGLSWLERKAAAVFFATPPTATIDEALTDFLAAHEQREEWIENLLYIARCYLQKGDKANAKTYLNLATKITPVDDHERELLGEVTKLLGKC